MRDIAGTPEDIFYLFIGAPDLLTESEVSVILEKSKTKLSTAETIDLLMWYGFLGLAIADGERVFIYDRAYDFRRLEADRRAMGEPLYIVNPAFLRGLKKRSN
jgi:hypothetical protein